MTTVSFEDITALKTFVSVLCYGAEFLSAKELAERLVASHCTNCDEQWTILNRGEYHRSIAL